MHRADGQPLGDIESAVRMGGRWYVATSEPLATAIWELESGSAREVTRVPRAGYEGGTRPVALRLAKRADGRMLGAIVDGPPMTEGAARPSRWQNQTWVLPIDVDSGTLHDPERLGYVRRQRQARARLRARRTAGGSSTAAGPAARSRVNAASGTPAPRLFHERRCSRATTSPPTRSASRRSR